MTPPAGSPAPDVGPERHDVVVVGAGPVGLLLAVELAHAGVRAVVLERLPRPTGESRASLINARSAAILDARGLLTPLDPAPERRSHFGGLPLRLDGVPVRFAGCWKVPQWRTERVLADAAVGLGADLRRGHELRGLVGDRAGPAGDVLIDVAGPSGRYRVRARHVVGCDGAGSTVRAAAGIGSTGSAARREMLFADVTGVEVPPRRFDRSGRGVVTAATPPGGPTRLMVHESGTAPRTRTGAPTFAEVAGAWGRVTGEDVASATPLLTYRLDDSWALAETYRSGPFLLAGDAARRHMPVGGLALNTGLCDAARLGPALAAHVRAPDAATSHALDRHAAARRAAGRGVLDSVRVQIELLFGDEGADPARQLFGELLALPSVEAHLAGVLSGVDDVRDGRRRPVT